MGYGAGIDLGCSFTRAAISRGGQSRMVPLRQRSILIPSVVHVDDQGSLVFGESDCTLMHPGRIGRDFKRQLGDPTPIVLDGQSYSAAELMAVNLKAVIDALTAAEGTSPERVVLTCPAVWGPYRRQQFDQVPVRAGIEVTVMTEPEAAATHYAKRMRLSDQDLVVVYDLGGGTFDTTVARASARGIEPIGAPEGIEWVGGADFDAAIFEHVDRVMGGAYSALDLNDPAAVSALERIRKACVTAKETLSRAEAAIIPVMLPYRHTQLRLTRAEFEAMIKPAITSTAEAVRRSMASAGVVADDLAAVLLVGGSSRIPLVSRMLSQELARPVLIDRFPQHCVALGAATVAGAALARQLPDESPRSAPARRRLLASAVAAAVVLGGAHTLSDSRSTMPSGPGPQPNRGTGVESSVVDPGLTPAPTGFGPVTDQHVTTFGPAATRDAHESPPPG